MGVKKEKACIRQAEAITDRTVAMNMGAKSPAPSLVTAQLAPHIRDTDRRSRMGVMGSLVAVMVAFYHNKCHLSPQKRQ